MEMYEEVLEGGLTLRVPIGGGMLLVDSMEITDENDELIKHWFIPFK